MPSELLRQVRVLDPVYNHDRIADVLIVDGVIQTVTDRIAELPQSLPDLQVCDRPNLILAPGLVDLYSHSGEPGYESRETLDSLLQAAAAGGVTRLVILPDTHPAIDTPAMLEWLRSRLQTLPSTPTQLYAWGAITQSVEGNQMTDLAELAAAGVSGFADGRPLSTGLLRRLLEYAEPLGKPIALWCCDPQLTGSGVVREGLESVRLGLPASPAMAETSALAALLECLTETGSPVHLMRISTARSVELIRAAKARGLPVTASTTWMHVLLDVRVTATYNPDLHLAPPLGNPADRLALLEGIREGVIDAIAIDHTPYTYEEKTVAFTDSPPGAVGLDLALPLLWHTLVASGELPALTLWRCLSTNPARCLNQAPASLQPQQMAEALLFDPEQPWQVGTQSLKSQSYNTPWLGNTVFGRVVKSWGRPA